METTASTAGSRRAAARDRPGAPRYRPCGDRRRRGRARAPCTGTGPAPRSGRGRSAHVRTRARGRRSRGSGGSCARRGQVARTREPTGRARPGAWSRRGRRRHRRAPWPRRGAAGSRAAAARPPRRACARTRAGHGARGTRRVWCARDASVGATTARGGSRRYRRDARIPDASRPQTGRHGHDGGRLRATPPGCRGRDDPRPSTWAAPRTDPIQGASRMHRPGGPVARVSRQRSSRPRAPCPSDGCGRLRRC
jgi:hypothetical protein